MRPWAWSGVLRNRCGTVSQLGRRRETAIGQPPKTAGRTDTLVRLPAPPGPPGGGGDEEQASGLVFEPDARHEALEPPLLLDGVVELEQVVVVDRVALVVLGQLGRQVPYRQPHAGGDEQVD